MEHDGSRDSIPRVNLQPPAVDFIDNHIDKYHPAFGNPPSRYDAKLNKYIIYQAIDVAQPPASAMILSELGADAPVPVEYEFVPRPLAQPTAALRFWDDLFPIAMAQFEKTHPAEPEAVAKYRIRDRKAWAEVYDQLETAKSQYYQTKGFKGGFRKIYRKTGDHVQPIIGVTKALPDIDMVTPVLGVVQLLLEAAKHAAQVRQAMSGAFDDIETMFSQVELFLKIYPGDQNIKKASVTLIAVTFRAVECVIGFFVKSTFKRFMSATFNLEEYQQKITQSLEAVKTQSQALITEADNSDKYSSSKTLPTLLQESRQSEQRIVQTVHNERTLVLNLFQELQENLARNQVAHNSAVFNMVQYHLSRIMTPTPPSDSPPSSASSMPALQSTSGTLVTSGQLLGLINIPNLSAIDMQTIKERQNDLIPKKQRAKAEHILNTPQFRHWLPSAASSQLLIHGDFTPPRPLSGTTHFCAILINYLAEHPQHISLNFFCGQHTESLEPSTGGRAMIQTFLCQLLSQYNFGPEYPVDQNLELIRAGDIGELCRLFESLFRRVDPGMCVFCIVDGILFYERSEFMQDAGVVVSMLLRLSAERQRGDVPVSKVLIASPTSTILTRQLFAEEQILSMAAMSEHSEDPSRMRLERRLREEDSGSSFGL